MHRLVMAFVAAVALFVVLPVVALADPPTNDNRAAAEAIPTFPAAVSGTTIEATVERLDPQVSKCGRVESTVWYRIAQAPDGTVVLRLRGTGLSPVLRVYNLTKNALSELTCASAKTNGAAQVSFETQRGASYLVLVGKRPSTADAAFTLGAQLFLPPPNDSRKEAQTAGKLPASLKGTTIGATSDDDDPEGCGLSGGTVWYSLKPASAKRIVLKLHAAGNFDASLAVASRIRSEVDSIGCARTDRKGNLVVAWDVDPGATYLIAVGLTGNSVPGQFTLQLSAAQPREVAPGVELRTAGVRSTVNWLSDVNDVYWRTLARGTTYRIAFTSNGGCAKLKLSGPTGELRAIDCAGYTTFTPGPEGGGRYVFEVTAPNRGATVGYRLFVGAAGIDDTGLGIALENLTTRRGSLSPAAGDAVDIYHFDVTQSSDVRLRLAGAKAHGFSLELLTDGGSRVGRADEELRRTLSRGRYVVAVRGLLTQPGGSYALSLVVRQLTSTSLTLPAAEVAPGSAVTIAVRAASPMDGWIDVQIDRFDPLDGWQFNRTIRLRAPGGTISWTPPALGRWRARASYLGTLRFSPSRSEYAYVLVATPIAA